MGPTRGTPPYSAATPPTLCCHTTLTTRPIQEALRSNRVPATSSASSSPSPSSPSAPPSSAAHAMLPDDVLRVQEPAIVKSKGRPRGSLNKAWAGASQRGSARQRAFERSTQREPSAFEYVPELPSTIPDSQQGRGRGGQRGRGSRGTRGGGRGNRRRQQGCQGSRRS